FVVGDRGEAVAEAEREEGDAGEEGASELELRRERLARAEVHRRRAVEEQERPPIALVLEALDRGPVGARPGPRVDAARIVAGAVLAVLGEDHARALVRAVVGAHVAAPRAGARTHGERGDAREEARIEPHFAHGRGTSSKRRER